MFYLGHEFTKMSENDLFGIYTAKNDFLGLFGINLSQTYFIQSLEPKYFVSNERIVQNWTGEGLPILVSKCWQLA